MQNTFINEDYLFNLVNTPPKLSLDDVLNDAVALKGLTLEQSAFLLSITNQQDIEKLFSAAKFVKEKVYGNRIVLFAPLYAANVCTNNCVYCAFRRDNKDIKRMVLTPDEVVEEAKAIMRMGHKRIILLTGEDYKDTGLDYIEEIMQRIYKTKELNGEIRRININIAPLTVDEFKRLNSFGIGTYQVFQETYHRQTYTEMHPAGKKSNYDWRLEAMDRALQAGIKDIGIGPLFGLADYKFETLATLAHAEHLDKTYGIGPHTISVPRIEPAEGVPFSKNPPAQMDDTEFKKVIATLRLAVPYTGMMLSTRETPKLRREILDLGVSQISAASKTNPGGYHVHKDVTSQFESGDTRCMEDIIKELCENDFLPSFCTACYRVGRVGEKFMEHAKSGHIHTFCEPNALATFEEYLQDYGNDELKSLGEALIQSRIAKISDDKIKEITKKNIQAIKEGQRDLYL